MKRREWNLDNVLKLPGLTKTIRTNLMRLKNLNYMKLNFEIDSKIPNIDGEYYIGYLPLKNQNHILIKQNKFPTLIKYGSEIELQEFIPTNEWSERAIGRFEGAYKLLDHIEKLLNKKKGANYVR